MKIWGYISAALLLLPAMITAASPALLTNQESLSLYQHAEIANVGNEKLSIEDFLNRQSELSFRPVKNANENIGFTSDNFWVRFSLRNASTESKVYYLQTARPITDEVNLYQVDDTGEVVAKKSGDQIAFKDRDFDHRLSIFKIKLNAGEKLNYYLHLGSDGEVISLPLKLMAPTEMVAATYRTELFHGLFYGVLILAAITYLFFFYGIREISFLHYGFYVLSIGLLQLALDGYLFQYLLPEGGFLNSRMVMVAALISIFFLGRYSETFLHVKKSFHKLHLVYRAIYAIAGILLVGIFIHPAVLKLSYPLGNAAGLVLLVLIIATVIAKRVKSQAVDPFYSMGIGFLVLGFVVFILNNMSILPNNFWTANSSKLGSGLEVIFLSISMSNRIRKLKSEKEKSQAVALRNSQEMNEIKNYFMSNMSHELRTPLNAIMGLAEQMRKKNQDQDSLNKNLEIIQYSSFSLLSSVNDILDFSKIEKGELRLQQSPFNPVNTLKEISENWRVQAHQKNLDYHLSIDDKLPLKCMGDADRLAQIANNILGNAIKFTHSGKVDVKVEAGKMAGEKLNLQLIVSDTGIGITKEKMETVFEAFLQENINNKRNFGGLGLGLSIVKKLVDLHGGEVNLQSNPGEGTVCSVSIPYQIVEKAKDKPVIDLENKDLKGARLLIVEDNALNQLVMKKILGGWQNTTFAAVENGEEALKLMNEEPFDLILMDLQMPVMDGYEATQRIRMGEANKLASKDIPIIAVTADTMESTREKVFSLGINDYMSKPVKSDLLFEKVATLIFDEEVGSAA